MNVNVALHVSLFWRWKAFWNWQTNLWISNYIVSGNLVFITATRAA